VTHVQSHFTDDRLRNHHIDAIDARQTHSDDALQFIGEMEVRIVLVLFLSFLEAVLPSLAVGPYRQKRAGASVIAGRIR
jgi:hypothetical protein